MQIQQLLQKGNKEHLSCIVVLCASESKREKGTLHIDRHWWDSPIDKKKHRNLK